MAADVNSFCLCSNSCLPSFLYLTHKDTPRMTHQGHSCPIALARTVRSSPNAFSGQPPSSDTANTQSPSTTSSRIVTPRACVTSCSEDVLTADLLVHPLSRNAVQVQQSHLQAVPILLSSTKGNPAMGGVKVNSCLFVACNHPYSLYAISTLPNSTSRS